MSEPNSTIPDPGEILAEIREHWDSDDTSSSLQHLQHVFEGYRAIVLGLDDCPYSPGGARAESWEAGANMAAADIRRASAIRDERLDKFGKTRAED